MTIFDGNPPPGRTRSKFVRVDGRISISNPNDTDILHGELLVSDNLLEAFEVAIDARPDDVDGGFIAFDSSRQRVTINGVSMGLDIPKNTEGRAKTVTLLEDQLRDYEVRSLMPAGLKSKESS